MAIFGWFRTVVAPIKLPEDNANSFLAMTRFFVADNRVKVKNVGSFDDGQGIDVPQFT